MVGTRCSAVILTALAVSFRLAPSGAQQAADATDVQELQRARPIERTLAQGETHAYRLPLQAGEYVRVLVERSGIFVRVTLSDPDKRPILSNNYNHALRPERVVTMAEVSGDFEVRVTCVAGGEERGAYRIRIDELRAGTAADRQRARAERLLADGLALRAEGTAASLKTARQRLQEALQEWRAAADRPGEAQTLAFMGSIAGALGEARTAIDLQRQALAIFREVGDRLGEGEALNNLGVQHYHLSEFQEAAARLEEARASREALQDLQGLASTLSNLASVYWAVSDPVKALDYNTRILPLRRMLKDRVGEARTLNNLGTVYEDLGEYQEALDHYRSALGLRRAAGDRRGEAYSLLTLGSLQHQLGAPREALDSLTEALRLQRLVGDRNGEASTLRVLARTQQALGHPLDALKHAREALALSNGSGDRAGEGATHTLIAQLRNDAGDRAAAQRASAEGIEICRAIGDRRCEAVASLESGRASTALGDLNVAAASLDRALTIARAIRDRAGEATARLDLARLARARGQLAEARDHADATLGLIESERSRVLSHELRATYLAARQHAYAFTIDLLIDMHAREPGRGYDAAALETSERARARSLLDLLADAGADIRAGVDPALLARERLLRHRLNALETNRARLVDRKRDEARVPEADKDIRNVLLEIADLRVRIRRDNPHYASIREPSPLSLAVIQQEVLDDDTAMVQYALGEARSVVWVVTRKGITTRMLPGKAAIETAARRLHALLMVSQTRQRRVEAIRATRDVAAMVLGPIAVDIGRAKRLTIVADGALQFVPFGALRLGATPLIARHEIVSLPSASTLSVLRRELKDRPPGTRLAAVIADPVLDVGDPRVKGRLARTSQEGARTPQGPSPSNSSAAPAAASSRPVSASASEVARAGRDAGVQRFARLAFTRQEANAIRALTGGRDSLFALDFDANLATAVEGGLADYRFVHFATHGLLNSRHPELSGLVLSLVDEHGLPRDGFLRLHDVYNLRLGADLVVLSACRTALGEDIRGEGLVGLVRGFMYAGAPRVLASLWDVRDEATAVLMRRFYIGVIRDGRPPAAALREGQVWMSQHPRWSAPYYWASFVLQGEWR